MTPSTGHVGSSTRSRFTPPGRTAGSGAVDVTRPGTRTWVGTPTTATGGFAVGVPTLMAANAGLAEPMRKSAGTKAAIRRLTTAFSIFTGGLAGFTGGLAELLDERASGRTGRKHAPAQP